MKASLQLISSISIIQKQEKVGIVSGPTNGINKLYRKRVPAKLEALFLLR